MSLSAECFRCPAEVFVISDLHVGGEYGSTSEDRGFRINTHVSNLSDFIHELRLRAEQTRLVTELVINGDFVDFLAEKSADEKYPWRAFISDEDQAVATLLRIVERDQRLFTAIGELIRSGVYVTLLLGNHDIELSLPAVREALRDQLGLKRADPFQFIHNGEAYVIGQDVLVEHGNRYDGWNGVDFDALRRRCSLASRRMPVFPESEFFPPPGSSLVEQLMNPIKVDYPFIDLVKPENEAAIPLLLALEPSFAADIDRIDQLSRLRSDADEQAPRAPAVPNKIGNISGRGWGDAAVQANAIEKILKNRLDADSHQRFAALIAEADEKQKGVHQQISGGGFGRALSFARMLLTRDWKKRLPFLLDGFRQIQSSKLFGRSEETEPSYLDAAQELSRGGFSTILFGHTHYAKMQTLDTGAKYINTGAWTDRIRLPDQIISGSREEALSSLERFADAIREKKFAPYIEFAPTFAYLQMNSDGRMQSADLRDYQKGSVQAL